MATLITEQCINCGMCESMCPSYGISKGEETYVIDPSLCTECVGYHKTEQCALVCPVECCVPDLNNSESEEQLFERALKAPYYGDERPTLTERTSHFRAKSWWESLRSGTLWRGPTGVLR